MRLDDVDARVVDQFKDTVELPRTRTPRVFVDEVSSASELMSIQCHAKLDVLRRLLLGLLERLQPFRIVAMYIFIKFLQITKQCARGEPIATRGADVFMSFQARFRSSTRLKSQPFVRSSGAPGTSPNLAASL